MLLLLALASAHPLDALTPYRTATSVSHVSAEMHWFTATFLKVENAGCHVGIPVAGDAEPLIGCYFPSGRFDDNDDSGHRSAFVAAQRLARRREGSLSGLRLHYVRTGREVVVEQVVPVEYPENPNVEVFEHSEVTYLWAAGELTSIRRVGGRGLQCYADDCADRVWLSGVTPAALEGTTVLLPALIGEPDPHYAAAELAMKPWIVAGADAWLSGAFTPVPSVPSETVLPENSGLSLRWELPVFARPELDERGVPRAEQVSWTPAFEVALTDALAGIQVFEAEHESLGVHIRAELDLPGERARVVMTGPDGVASRDVKIVGDVLHDGPRAWWRRTAEWTELAREPAAVEGARSDDRISLDGQGDIATVDLYMRPPERTSTTAHLR